MVGAMVDIQDTLQSAGPEPAFQVPAHKGISPMLTSRGQGLVTMMVIISDLAREVRTRESCPGFRVIPSS